MPAKRFFALVSLLLLVIFVPVDSVRGQEKLKTPDVSVAGVKLGDPVSGEKLLKEYQPTTGDTGLPTYYFYNKFANSVMKLTGESFDAPHKIMEIEVFAVGRSYMGRHFQLKDVGHFVTESGIFIGFRQTGKSKALAIIVGIPNISRDNMIGPNDVIDRLGEPAERSTDGDTESFDYRLDQIDLETDDAGTYGYASHFEFRDHKLKRFAIKLLPRQTAKN